MDKRITDSGAPDGRELTAGTDKHTDTSSYPKDNSVEQALYQNALKGSATAQIFWLKNRRPERWNDKAGAGSDPFEQAARIARANREAAEAVLEEST